MLTFLATLDLESLQAEADVDGTYLNGDMDRHIYIRTPEGMRLTKESCDSLLLLKTLYGLKQSGRAWWIVLGGKLVEMGFTRCESDWGLYVERDNQGRTTMIVLVYVDDILAAAKTKAEINKLFDDLEDEWKISRLGEVASILGMKVSRNRSERVIHLHQGGYIDRLAQKFPNLPSRIGNQSPLPAGQVTTTNNLLPAITPYQELVGSLLRAASCTRPELAFAASFLGRFASVPDQAHWVLGMRCIAYLQNSRGMVLEIGGRDTAALVTYVDSDWGGCHETRRSTTVYVSFIYGSASNWMSRRQATTAGPTMEAEYIAAAEASNDIMWLRSLFRELGIVMGDATTLFIDNESAIKLGGNPTTHARSKHIDIKHHILRERAEANHIKVVHVKTNKQRADIFIKARSQTREQHSVAATCGFPDHVHVSHLGNDQFGRSCRCSRLV